MGDIRAKKSFGQHFLKDEKTARRIVDSLHNPDKLPVLEVGPGMGMLTKYLLMKYATLVHVAEADKESVAYLKQHYPELGDRVHAGDFLKMPLHEMFPQGLVLIGNFPYNISSQIMFKVLEHKNLVHEVVGMFQKEVAQRIHSTSGNKVYGVLSVLMQAFYDTNYLFTVGQSVFQPPPNVNSGVLRINRNPDKHLPCNEKIFFRVVKKAFNQRRKTMRNSLKTEITAGIAKDDIFNKRPEQLTVEQLKELAAMIEEAQKCG